jgi:hypothetical protein
MTGDSTVEAVELADGSRAWKTAVALTPTDAALAGLVNGRVLAFTSQPRNLALLDPEAGPLGEPIRSDAEFKWLEAGTSVLYVLDDAVLTAYDVSGAELKVLWAKDAEDYEGAANLHGRLFLIRNATDSTQAYYELTAP